MTEFQGFILSNAQIRQDNATRLVFQGRLSDGRRFHWTVTRPGIVFFVDRFETWLPEGAFRRNVDLRSLRGSPVDALYFRNPQDLARARQASQSRAITTYEADVNPVARFLMERFIQGGVAFESAPLRVAGETLYFFDPKVRGCDFAPALRLLSIDIECSLERELYSIALCGNDLERVLMLDPNPLGVTDAYTGFRSERELLAAFFRVLRDYDPDALIGWNLVGFDLQWLARKCAALGMSLDIGTDGPADILQPGSVFKQWTARIPGRAALDGIPMARSAFLRTDDYALSTVAHKVLGRQKLIEQSGEAKAAEITRLFHADKARLAAYNLEDTRLVHEIFEKLSFAQLAVRRSQLTGLALDRIGGSVAAFDFLYLPRLHRCGFVADTHPRAAPGDRSAPGGLVLDSRPGFYRNVAVFDFKSLYPSIIRTFSIDPLAACVLLHDLKPAAGAKDSPAAQRTVQGPAGLGFAESFAILPGIIQDLWHAREKAKQAQDPTLSQAVKIIMNSFYGVLGSPGCRFYDPRLAGTITRTGHWVLTFSREFIEQAGFPVIYGDTDSLFVDLGAGGLERVRDHGLRLSARLNRRLEEELRDRFRVESHLTIQFEKIFARFFMPTIRGRETGSKKRYAGLLVNENGVSELYFAGLESSRRDWTELAKDFQADLFALLFGQDETRELKDRLGALVRDRHRQLHDGRLDDKLVYHKGISKPLNAYTKNVPPHVRAARMLERLEGRIVRYVMTTAGPEPSQKRSGAPYDYGHYSDKQLAPIADMVLRFFDLDYASLVGGRRQLNLFEHNDGYATGSDNPV